jgi:hypothetical protein
VNDCVFSTLLLYFACKMCRAFHNARAYLIDQSSAGCGLAAAGGGATRAAAIGGDGSGGGKASLFFGC